MARDRVARFILYGTFAGVTAQGASARAVRDRNTALGSPPRSPTTARPQTEFIISNFFSGGAILLGIFLSFYGDEILQLMVALNAASCAAMHACVCTCCTHRGDEHTHERACRPCVVLTWC